MEFHMVVNSYDRPFVCSVVQQRDNHLPVCTPIMHTPWNSFDETTNVHKVQQRFESTNMSCLYGATKMCDLAYLGLRK